MTHVITSLCLRDGGCVAVCPVECIVPGKPQEEWPIYYIDPNTCIDCGACIAECPFGAIYTLNDVPSRYIANGNEVLTAPEGTQGFSEAYEGYDYEGNPVYLPATRQLSEGEIVNLTPDIQNNREFFETGSGYTAIDYLDT